MRGAGRLVAGALLLAGCGAGTTAGADLPSSRLALPSSRHDSQPGRPSGQPALPPPPLPASQAALPTGVAQVGPVRLQVELATTPDEQEAGLRGRALEAGHGMAFPYPGGQVVRFTMAGVTDPVTAVFAAAGSVVSVAPMAPCAGTVAACPTYGPPTPVDLVVEGLPAELAAVRPGDRVLLPAG